MIKKIVRIQNVSAYQNFGGSGDELSFGKNTIIYAENGLGKSTIATILKSYKNKDSALITERKTIKDGKTVTGDQKITIKHDGGTTVFENEVWTDNNSPMPSFEVFDQKYVHDNLFIETVESNHKKSIHGIVIGEQGLSLREALVLAKEKEKNLRGKLNNEKEQLEERKYKTGRNDYLLMKKEEKEGIEKLIQSLSEKLHSFQEQNSIRALANQEPISGMEFDFAKLDDVSSLSIESAHLSAKIHVDRHLLDNSNCESNGLAFIQSGLKLKKSENCPFCGQNLSNANQLLEAYQEYFNEAYDMVKESVTTYITSIKKWNPEAETVSLEKKITDLQHAMENLQRKAGEKTIITQILTQIETIQIDSFNEELVSFKSQVITEFNKKEKDVNYSPTIETLHETQTKLKEMATKITSVNQSLLQLSSDFKKELEKLSAMNENKEKEKLGKIKEQALRFSDSEIQWCKEYDELKLIHSQAEISLQKTGKDLSGYSKLVFERYQKSVNKLLKNLGVTFSIMRFKEKTDKRANEPFADFGLCVNGKDIPINAKGSPCFINTLSEGEKNALSFAFFVTTLQEDPNLADKILVFDDPLSSLDDHRRSLTADTIQDLSTKTQQTIILTHKKDFLELLYSKLDGAKTLSLSKDNKNGSMIIPLDMEEFLKPDHRKMLDELVRYIDEDCAPKKTIQGNIRIVIEDAIKYKYYLHLEKNTKSFGNMIKELHKKGFFPSIINTLQKLNDISCPQHHGGNELSALITLTRPELISYVEQTINILEKI